MQRGRLAARVSKACRSLHCESRSFNRDAEGAAEVDMPLGQVWPAAPDAERGRGEKSLLAIPRSPPALTAVRTDVPTLECGGLAPLFFLFGQFEI